MAIHSNMSHDEAKNAAGLQALEFIKEGMLLGLGTGTTAQCFIQHLIKKCQKGLNIKAVATSIASETMAREGGIPLLDVNAITSLDLTVDGADEIDPKMRLIKGAGGALVREKIIASMSREMIVIADQTKQVDKLGKHPLAVEVTPFAKQAIQRHFEDLKYTGQWRRKPSGALYITDNHNWIYDITFSKPLDHPETIHNELIQIPGVVDTGFFFHLATCVIIGRNDGTAVLQP